jgi:transposase
MARFDLMDFKWSVIQPLLPDKPHGDRRVMNGISGGCAPGLPGQTFPRYGPYTTCYRTNATTISWPPSSLRQCEFGFDLMSR